MTAKRGKYLSLNFIIKNIRKNSNTDLKYLVRVFLQFVNKGVSY